MLDRKGTEEALIAKAMKDQSFRKALIEDPKAMIASEYGAEIPDSVEIKVVEETANKYYVVLPSSISGELRDEELEAVAGGKAGCPTEEMPVPVPPPTTEPKKCLCGPTTVPSTVEQ
jgi:hypothetical protein